LAEEPDQALEVLRSCREEELLSHELQPPQAQAAESDLILFSEQCFHLLSLPLCTGELWRLRQLASALPGWFVHVNGKKPESSAGALRLQRTPATTLSGSNVR
jgi:hypothetical protein